MGHGLQNKQSRSLLNELCCERYQLYTSSHLFNTVRIDGGLWLQYADRFRFLGTLRHFADFLRNEVVDTIESLNSTLYQADTLCCSCERGDRWRTQRSQWPECAQKCVLGVTIRQELPLAFTVINICIVMSWLKMFLDMSQCPQQGRSWKKHACLVSHKG